MGVVKDFVLKIFNENRKDILTILIVATLGSLIATMVPYVYGRLFDMAIVPNSNINLIFFLILLWLSMSLISNYTTNKTSEIGEVLAIKISLKSEYEGYSHFLGLPIPFHKKERRGEVLQKISRSSWSLQSFVDLFSSVLPQFMMLLFSVIAMFILKWELALVIVFSFAVYTYLTIRKTKYLTKLHENEEKKYEKAYGKVYDKLYNVFLVKNFATEEKEKHFIRRELIDKLIPISRNSYKRYHQLSLVQDFIYTVTFVLVLGLAVLFLRIGALTPGQFVMFFGYTNLAFAPFRHIAAIYRTLRKTSVSLRRLEKLKKLRTKPRTMFSNERLLTVCCKLHAVLKQ